MQRCATWVVLGFVMASLAGCGKSATAARESSQFTAPPLVEGARGPYGTNYRAPTGEFIVQMPEAPEMREEADGRTVYQLRTADYAYTINKLDCPSEFAGEADPTALYDKLRETVVAAVDGQAMSEHPLTSFGRKLPGRELVVVATTPRTGEKYEMLVRLFRDGDSVWLLQAIGKQEATSRLDRLGVLNSFTFLE